MLVAKETSIRIQPQRVTAAQLVHSKMHQAKRYAQPAELERINHAKISRTATSVHCALLVTWMLTMMLLLPVSRALEGCFNTLKDNYFVIGAKLARSNWCLARIQRFPVFPVYQAGLIQVRLTI